MIGILGGTFDPVHFGHLRSALEVYQALGLRELRLVPLRRAVHRFQPLASPEQRLAMLRVALAGEPGLTIDDRELRRPGPSYSFDTLRELRSELGPEEGICLLLGVDAFGGFSSWHRPDGILELAHLVVMRRPGLAGKGPKGEGAAGKSLDAKTLTGLVQMRETLGDADPALAENYLALVDLDQTLADMAPVMADLDPALANWSSPRLCARAGDLAAAPAGRIWFQEVTQMEISATQIRQLVARGLSPRFLLPDAVLDFILAAGLYRPAPGSPGLGSLGLESPWPKSLGPKSRGLEYLGPESGGP